MANKTELDALIDDVAYGLIDGKLSSTTIAYKVAALREHVAVLERDRNEWKEQHENLLAMYRTLSDESAALKEKRSSENDA